MENGNISDDFIHKFQEGSMSIYYWEIQTGSEVIPLNDNCTCYLEVRTC